MWAMSSLFITGGSVKRASFFSSISKPKVVNMSYVGVGVSPSDVPAYHSSSGSSKMKTIDRRIRATELVLRCLILCLAVVSAVLIGTASQVREIFAVRKRATFTDMKALVFLVIANGIAAAYSLVQVVRCVVSVVRGSVLFNKHLAWVIFSGDQVMAYLTLAAVSASAQSAVFSKLGLAQLQWMRVCDLYGKFCNRVGEGIASSVLVGISAIVLSTVSAFNLFRLYGGGRSSSW